MYSKTSESTSEKEAVYRPPFPPPPPTLLSGKISGEGAAAHRLPKSLGINFDLDFCYTHFNWLYKKLGRFPFIRIKMNLKLSTTITNVNLQVFVGSVNKKKSSWDFIFAKLKNFSSFSIFTTKKKIVADNIQISSSTSELCVKICLV